MTKMIADHSNIEIDGLYDIFVSEFIIGVQAAALILDLKKTPQIVKLKDKTFQRRFRALKDKVASLANNFDMHNITEYSKMINKIMLEIEQCSDELKGLSDSNEMENELENITVNVFQHKKLSEICIDLQSLMSECYMELCVNIDFDELSFRILKHRLNVEQISNEFTESSNPKELINTINVTLTDMIKAIDLVTILLLAGVKSEDWKLVNTALGIPFAVRETLTFQQIFSFGIYKKYDELMLILAPYQLELNTLKCEHGTKIRWTLQFKHLKNLTTTSEWSELLRNTCFLLNFVRSTFFLDTSKPNESLSELLCGLESVKTLCMRAVDIISNVETIRKYLVYLDKQDLEDYLIAIQKSEGLIASIDLEADIIHINERLNGFHKDMVLQLDELFKLTQKYKTKSVELLCQYPRFIFVPEGGWESFSDSRNKLNKIKFEQIVKFCYPGISKVHLTKNENILEVFATNGDVLNLSSAHLNANTLIKSLQEVPKFFNALDSALKHVVRKKILLSYDFFSKTNPLDFMSEIIPASDMRTTQSIIIGFAAYLTALIEDGISDSAKLDDILEKLSHWLRRLFSFELKNDEKSRIIICMTYQIILWRELLIKIIAPGNHDQRLEIWNSCLKVFVDNNDGIFVSLFGNSFEYGYEFSAIPFGAQVSSIDLSSNIGEIFDCWAMKRPCLIIGNSINYNIDFLRYSAFMLGVPIILQEVCHRDDIWKLSWILTTTQKCDVFCVILYSGTIDAFTYLEIVEVLETFQACSNIRGSIHGLICCALQNSIYTRHEELVNLKQFFYVINLCEPNYDQIIARSMMANRMSNIIEMLQTYRRVRDESLSFHGNTGCVSDQQGTVYRLIEKLESYSSVKCNIIKFREFLNSEFHSMPHFRKTSTPINLSNVDICFCLLLREKLWSSYYIKDELVIDKCMELYWALNGEKSIILHGPCASGKTICIKVVSSALETLHQKFTAGLKRWHFRRIYPCSLIGYKSANHDVLQLLKTLARPFRRSYDCYIPIFDLGHMRQTDAEKLICHLNYKCQIKSGGSNNGKCIYELGIIDILNTNLQGWFLFSLVWSFGCLDSIQSRLDFEKHIRELLRLHSKNNGTNKIDKQLYIFDEYLFPDEFSIYEYRFIGHKDPSYYWQPWIEDLSLLLEYNIIASINPFEIDRRRYCATIEILSMLFHSKASCLIFDMSTVDDIELAIKSLAGISRLFSSTLDFFNLANDENNEDLKKIFNDRRCKNSSIQSHQTVAVDGFGFAENECEFEALRNLLDDGKVLDKRRGLIQCNRNVYIFGIARIKLSGQNFPERVMRHFALINTNVFGEKYLEDIFTKTIAEKTFTENDNVNETILKFNELMEIAKYHESVYGHGLRFAIQSIKKLKTITSSIDERFTELFFKEIKGLKKRLNFYADIKLSELKISYKHDPAEVLKRIDDLSNTRNRVERYLREAERDYGSEHPCFPLTWNTLETINEVVEILNRVEISAFIVTSPPGTDDEQILRIAAHLAQMEFTVSNELVKEFGNLSLFYPIEIKDCEMPEIDEFLRKHYKWFVVNRKERTLIRQCVEYLAMSRADVLKNKSMSLSLRKAMSFIKRKELSRSKSGEILGWLRDKLKSVLTLEFVTQREYELVVKSKGDNRKELKYDRIGYTKAKKIFDQSQERTSDKQQVVKDLQEAIDHVQIVVEDHKSKLNELEVKKRFLLRKLDLKEIQRNCISGGNYNKTDKCFKLIYEFLNVPVNPSAEEKTDYVTELLLYLKETDIISQFHKIVGAIYFHSSNVHSDQTKIPFNRVQYFQDQIIAIQNELRNALVPYQHALEPLIKIIETIVELNLKSTYLQKAEQDILLTRETLQQPLEEEIHLTLNLQKAGLSFWRANQQLERLNERKLDIDSKLPDLEKKLSVVRRVANILENAVNECEKCDNDEKTCSMSSNILIGLMIGFLAEIDQVDRKEIFHNWLEIWKRTGDNKYSLNFNCLKNTASEAYCKYFTENDYILRSVRLLTYPPYLKTT
ncbi:hypothetical protein ACOME3_001033 [Neoechinorhynchus agilis]